MALGSRHCLPSGVFTSREAAGVWSVQVQVSTSHSVTTPLCFPNPCHAGPCLYPFGSCGIPILSSLPQGRLFLLFEGHSCVSAVFLSLFFIRDLAESEDLRTCTFPSSPRLRILLGTLARCLWAPLSTQTCQSLGVSGLAHVPGNLMKISLQLFY